MGDEPERELSAKDNERPTAAERSALDEVGPILRFAAESVDKLDPEIPSALAEARDAASNCKWTPAISQRFWEAFHNLCIAIRPVTTDDLAAATASVEVLSPWRLSRVKVSLSTRSSGRYLWLLFTTIFIAIALQLYVWICAIESKRIDDNFSALKTEYGNLYSDYDKLSSEMAEDATNNTKPFSRSIENQQVGVICRQLLDFSSDIDRVQFSAGVLVASSITNFGLPADESKIEDCYSNVWTTFDGAIGRYNRVRGQAAKAQEVANLESGIALSFLLPILFGLIGAVTYVVREISDQIKSTTFSRTSPVRHLMRATLGALAGLVVGLFNGLSTHFNLPPLAFAFLAGYGVEALFSMFDGIVAKFRQV